MFLLLEAVGISILLLEEVHRMLARCCLNWKAHLFYIRKNKLPSIEFWLLAIENPDPKEFNISAVQYTGGGGVDEWF